MSNQKLLILSLCALSGLGTMACAEDTSSSAGATCSSQRECSNTQSCSTIDEASGTRVCVEKDVCTNGKKDKDYGSYNETDIDCGGICGATCAENKHCLTDNDCMTGLKCNEQHVCEIKKCSNDSECAPYTCNTSTGSCVIPETTTCADHLDQLLINEFMAAPDNTKTSTSSFTLNGNVEECKFAEVVNKSDKSIALDGCTLVIQRTDADKSSKTPLVGSLPPKGAAIVHDCDTLALPANALNLKMSTPASLTQGGTYELYISANKEDGTEVKSKVMTSEAATKGTSMNLSKDLDDTSTALIKHTDVPGSVAVASPGYCVNGGLFSNGCQSTCGNNQKDGAESDVDCGGVCAKCAKDKACNSDDDCASAKCTEHKCVDKACEKPEDCGDPAKWSCDAGACNKLPACDDNEKNGTESDIDCGGSCANKCLGTQSCNGNEDCKYNNCVDGKCVDPSSRAAQATDLVINEVLVYANTSSKFDLLDGEHKQCEFVEIVNVSSEAISLDNVTVNIASPDGGSTKKLNTALSGILKGKTALIMHNCELPLKGGAVSYPIDANIMTNEHAYDVTLTVDGTEAQKFSVNIDLGKLKGKSANLATDLNKSANIVDHSTLEGGYVASPGICSNGGFFSTGCVNTCSDKKLSGDESDIDCGGSCAKCADGATCNKPEDCASNSCENGHCATTKCTDNEQCDAATTCGLCNYVTGQCITGETPAAGDIIINEVLNDADGKLLMPMTKFGEQMQVEFVELQNTTNKRLMIKGLTIQFDKDADNTSDKTYNVGQIKGNACLEPNQFYVSYYLKDKSQYIEFTGNTITANDLGSSIMTNEHDYILTLLNGSSELHKVFVPGDKTKFAEYGIEKYKKGVSQIYVGGIYQPVYNNMDMLIYHDDYQSSDGYVCDTMTPGADNFTNLSSTACDDPVAE